MQFESACTKRGDSRPRAQFRMLRFAVGVVARGYHGKIRVYRRPRMIQQPFDFAPAGGIYAAGCSACIAQEHRVGSCVRVLPQPLCGVL